MQPLDAQSLLARWSPRVDQRVGIPILAALSATALALACWGFSDSDAIRDSIAWSSLALIPPWLAWTWRVVKRPVYVLAIADLELETSPYAQTPAGRDYYVKFAVRAAVTGVGQRAIEVVDLTRFPRAAQIDAQAYGALLHERACTLVLDHALRPLGVELADGRQYRV